MYNIVYNMSVSWHMIKTEKQHLEMPLVNPRLRTG